MYIAYMDDSRAKPKDSTYQVLTAVIMNANLIIHTEMMMAAALSGLIPQEKRVEFEEFKAWELFGGYGVFEGVEQTLRHSTIATLLSSVCAVGASIVYGAVNIPLLREKIYGSAEPLDVCFRRCVEGISKWMKDNASGNQALLIADDCDPKIKSVMSKSFRQMRQQLTSFPQIIDSLPWNLHDGLYFGNSVDSIGIQLADLCSYFIAKHLEGDPSGEGFFKLIEKSIVYSKIDPAD
jgi:hypothetical protein